ncbi:MAG: response regulator transcription factor [Bacteroidetes bacterium]|nr:response regulator transcription factor [Bacteroidota bacterium]MBS1629003.1 response regulator transcription factor [Bacteroidota bacterium]
MIRAIAIDDEPPALRIIERFASSSEQLQLLRTFTHPKEALKFLEREMVDLIFLDIQMPSVSGLDLYKSLPKGPMVIFTTAYSEYAVEGFELQAVDYLLKPFTRDRFEKAVEKAQNTLEYQQQIASGGQQFISIRADYSTHRISLTDIRYIEGLDDYLKIHLDNARPIVARLTMKAMVEMLPAGAFMRVHRSYIIPLKRITMVRNKSIYIGEVQIPIGGSYEEAFFKAF